MPLLIDHDWKGKYRRTDGSLVDLFYVPALRAAQYYRRTTGYFSAGALTLAARGIEGLIRNDGRMWLLVGCTLDAPEIEAIEAGLDLRAAVEQKLLATPLVPESPAEASALELLAWLVERGILEVRVAVPRGEDGRYLPSPTIFHEKAGIIEDKAGHRLAFNGSMNETAQGWSSNWESFHVFCDWRHDRSRVEEEQRSFERLWGRMDPSADVLDVPEAVAKGLLNFRPKDGQLPARVLLLDTADALAPTHADVDRVETPTDGMAPNLIDERAALWDFIRRAPAEPPDGDRVGEATSAIEPWPHQIRAFDRMWSRFPCRLLVADEVGLGKTIEAGLLLRQAWLSGRARRILVMAPKAVLTQWQIELRDKFNLSWPIYDGARLTWLDRRAQVVLGERERVVTRQDWHREPCLLVSSHLMRRSDRHPELLEHAEPWDLVVLDEAHHARRRGTFGSKNNGPNLLLRLMQGLRHRAKGLVLLTATPMQVHPAEVWDLLDLLGLPKEWSVDAFLRFFDRVSLPNPSDEDLEFLSRLFQAMERDAGPMSERLLDRATAGLSPLKRRRIVKALREQYQAPRKQLNAEERRVAQGIFKAGSPVAALISRHTRDLLRAYAREGKLGSRIATRQVEDLSVPMSIEEREVYDAVEAYIRSTYDAANSKERNAVGFVMTIYRRRVASSFTALRETLKDRLDALEHRQVAGRPFKEDAADEESDEDTESPESVAEVMALRASESADIRSLLELVKGLPADTKATHLVSVVAQLRVAGYDQAIVFTQYTDTVDFLREQLVAAGSKVLCYSGRGGESRGHDGTWRLRSRDDIKRSFKAGQADVLVCTDAAAEGLNFQFCGALVNYDMPWNPMRVEQRIGRIDRLGQAFDHIRIVNLHYEDTVETDVYLALRQRIALFGSVVGKLQPILAQLPKRLAELSLRGDMDRDRQRDETLTALQRDIEQARQETFDLDAITPADLELPTRAAPAFDLAWLEGAVLQRPELLPPGWSVEPLPASGEYALTIPGHKERFRVTTSRTFYEDHPDSAELWSPGSPTFPSPA